MAHRALTLKYRPQVFADMVGQDHVSLVLARALESGRVAHAYLFSGARGVGKTTSARILAKALNCEKRASGELKGPDPCNQCTSCLEITSGVSLDVAEIDGASNRGIADVQALREKVRFSPAGGRYRVVIIDEVHQLSNDAFAALLKTLEEPPAHLVFIFATTDPQKLPDTIRSRTQRFDFARVPLRKVADRLLDIAKREAKDKEGVKFTLTEGAALLIAQKSEGALRDAVSALDQVISSGEREVDEELVRRVLGLADREAFFTLAGAILARDPKSALQALHRAFEKGLDPRDLAEGLGEHVRHILVLKVDPDGDDLVPATSEEIGRLREQGRDWSENDLLRLLKLAAEALTPMKDSPQPLVHLEAAVLQMATLEPGETLGELLQRLEALERRLGGGAADVPAGPTRASAKPPVVRETAPAPPARPVPAGSRSSGTGSRSGPRGYESETVSAVATSAPARSASTSNVTAAAPPSRPSWTPSANAAPVAGPTPAAIAPVPSLAPRPAPASASATAVAEEEPPVLDERTLTCWREVIAAVNARKRMLGAFLEESRFLGVTGNVLVLGADDLHRAVIEESENRKLLDDEVRRAFGQPLEFLCGGEGIVPVETQAPASAQLDVQAMIDRAVAWFDGEQVVPVERRSPAPRERRERSV
jgi:DNA polymerase-3 subunit gamma/tau